jgi:hypothetical protein
MRSDADDTTDVVELRTCVFVIRRGGRDAIRMRDLQSANRREFHGIESYRYRISCRSPLRAVRPAASHPDRNIIGMVDGMESWRARFELGGKTIIST